MGNLLQLVGSIVIGGLLLLILVRTNVGIQRAAIGNGMDRNMVSNTTALAEIIEYDLRKIGYRIASNRISIADSNRLKFKCDIDNNGSPDTIEYYMSDSTALSTTPNPFDKLLYRIVNNSSPNTSNLGVMNIKFFYYDIDGNVTTNVLNIKYVKFQLRTQAPYYSADQYDGSQVFSGAYLERTIRPKNLF